MLIAGTLAKNIPKMEIVQLSKFVREIWIMNPFGWKDSPFWLLLLLPIFAVLMGLGIGLGHDLLSAVLSIAVISGLICLYVRKKSKKPNDEQKE